VNYSFTVILCDTKKAVVLTVVAKAIAIKEIKSSLKVMEWRL